MEHFQGNFTKNISYISNDVVLGQNNAIYWNDASFWARTTHSCVCAAFLQVCFYYLISLSSLYRHLLWETLLVIRLYLVHVKFNIMLR